MDVVGGEDFPDGARHIQASGIIAGVGLVGHGVDLSFDDKLVVVQVPVVGGDAEVFAHVLAAQTFLPGHQSFKELFAVAGADDVGAGVAEKLLDGLGQIPDCGSVGLLDEQVAGVGVLEGEHHQIHGLVQVHEEAGHIGVRDGDRAAGLDLVNEQGDDRATGAHDISVASAANGGAAPLGGYPGVGVNHMLHHSLGNAHGVDGIGGLIGGQANHTLDPRVNGGVEHIVRSDDIGLDGLHGEELAGRNLLQSSGVENVVNTRHGILDRLGIANISDVELHLLGSLRMLGLKLMAHIILLLLIPGEDADFLQVGVQEVL